jgi:hypothetical protein
MMDVQCDARVQRLATPKECRIFERNASDRSRDDLALQARQRWIELSADDHVGKTDENDALARELWESLSAYEYVLGRSATGLRQTIRRRGLIRAAEHFATKGDMPVELAALADAGLIDYAWEHAVLRHPEVFSGNVAELSRERLAAHESEVASTATD